VIRAGTLPMSLRTVLLLMSALQDRFLRMLETTWWSSSLSDSSWATSAWRQICLEHRVACRETGFRLHMLYVFWYYCFLSALFDLLTPLSTRPSHQWFD